MTGNSDAAGLCDLQSTLSEIIDQKTVGFEDIETDIPGLSLFRREKPTIPCPCLVEPSVVLVSQGTKQLLIGERAYIYDTTRFLLTSLELPGNSSVLEASPQRPSLGLSLKLDLSIVSSLIGQVGPPPTRSRMVDESAAIGALTRPLLEPFARLVALLDEPRSIGVMAPLIEREIHYRLLETDLAPRLLQIISVGSQTHRIARAIDWLKSNYDKPLRIDALAAHVHMSASSLHQHFRQLTAMSPLQYQKWLRLTEARRLMLDNHLAAAEAGFQVGYESPSQFSREYTRFFGAPPRRDLESLKQAVEAVLPGTGTTASAQRS